MEGASEFDDVVAGDGWPPAYKYRPVGRVWPPSFTSLANNLPTGASDLSLLPI